MNKKRKDGSVTVRSWTKDNQTYIAAFLMPFLTMLVIFAGARIFPFGDRSFLHIDMYHQYFPFLTDMYRAIHSTGEGSSLLYSWNAGLGTNFTALYTYYLASPVNWLCAICPEKYLMEFMSYFVVVKIGFCGFTCAYYLSKHFDTKSITVAFFGMFYAMSGYIAAYNWDVMWLDPIMLTPLVVLGLEQLVKDGSYKLYTITLAVSILSNYYICIMLCIYLVLYYLCVLLPAAQMKLRSFIRFAVYSAWAGIMAAVLLVPEVLALQLSKFSSSTFPQTAKTYFAIFDVMARHLMDVAVETGLDHWPNIFCSVSILALLPLYIICSKVKATEKIGKCVLLGFFLISFSSNVLTYIWHGLNYPDSLPCRQSYLYILLILAVCYEAFLNIREFEATTLGAVLAGVVAFVVICQKVVTDDGITGRSYLLSVASLAAYSLLIHFYRKKERGSEKLVYAAIVIVVLEAGINMMLTSVPTVSRSGYLKDYYAYNNLYDDTNELSDGRFYRYDKTARVTNNDSMLQNYMSTSLFSSISNGLVNSFYSKYGMRTSKVFYCGDGMTPFMSGLLSQKYIYSKDDMSDNPLCSLIESDDDIKLYAYDKSLPLGYMLYEDDVDCAALIEDRDTAFALIDGDIEDPDKDLNPIERQNALAYKLGATSNMYEYVDESYAGSSATIIPETDGIYMAYLDTKKVNTLKMITTAGEKSFKKIKNPYIVNLGWNNADEGILLNDEDGADLCMTAYRFNIDVYNEIMDRLGADTLNLQKFEATDLVGSINATKNGYLVLSVPYDPGWSVYVDGEKTETKLCEDMMTAIELGTGMHNIEMKYCPQGFIPGIIISLLAISGFAALIIFGKDKKI